MFNEKAKRLLASICALFILALSGCSPAGNLSLTDSGSVYRQTYTAPESVAVPVNPETVDGYQKVAENAALKLFYNPEEDTIQVHDRQGDAIWSSAVDWESYGLQNPNTMQAAVTGSLFSLVYTDTGSNEGKLNTVYSKNEPSTRSHSYLKNGISLAYRFTLLKITVTLNIILEEDGLSLSFPSDKITEESRYLLMSLQLLPAFGASNQQDEGYIMYPDGSGALLRYENCNDRPSNRSNFSLGVYSAFDSKITDYYQASGLIKDSIEAPPTYNASLPVFGVKKGDAAFLAYVTLGDAQSRINVCPQGHLTGFNRAFFEFQYRNTFEIIGSNISAGGSSNKNKTPKVDKSRMQQDYTVKYRFLSGEDANYSGMARTYRSILEAQGILQDRASSTVPLALDLFCGITEERMLMNAFINMTTFDQAKNISQRLLDAGVTSQSLTLKGWTDNGYGTFPLSTSAAGPLGGNNGLRSLAEYASQNGIQFYAQFNPLLAISGNAGFSVRTDAVYQGNSLAFSDATNTYYLLSPMAAAKKILSIGGYLQQLGNIGLSLEGLSQYVYEDYRDGATYTRTGTAALWQDIMASLPNGLAAEGANQYVLPYASRLYNLPTSSSQTSLADENIPFLQMVIHGSVFYSSEPCNLFYDKKQQKLQWIEYGCMPYFELTAQCASQLKYTTYNRLYTSYYEDWLDDAVALYQECNTALAGTWDTAITEHTHLSETLVKLTYENGKSVYINYDKEAITVEGHEIPAEDYRVVG